MLLFLGTGKSLQRILLAPVKIPTQEPAENPTDSESKQLDSLFTLLQALLSDVVVRVIP